MQNGIRYVKQLEKVGLTRDQAETHVQIMTEIMDTHLATKTDLREGLTGLESSIMADLRALENRMELGFRDLQHQITQSEQKMTIKLGTIVSIAIGVAVALAKIV